MLKISNILQGGLGNYLFQIAAGYATALRHNKEYIASLYGIQTGHRHISKYFDNILRNVKFSESPISNYAYNEPSFSFNVIPNFEMDIMLKGYYQSDKYFKDFKNEIKNFYGMRECDCNFLNEKYGSFENSCSINFRRGDYLNLQDYHPVPNINFYKKSIAEVSKTNKNLKYFISSDDIDWCKNNLNFIENSIFVDGNEDYQDLYLISKCDHNIICNSTFGWWGAWLNDNPNKIVIAPKLWFGPRFNGSFDDIYPEGWLKF
jgi:hypothetical protein